MFHDLWTVEDKTTQTTTTNTTLTASEDTQERLSALWRALRQGSTLTEQSNLQSMICSPEVVVAVAKHHFERFFVKNIVKLLEDKQKEEHGVEPKEEGSKSSSASVWTEGVRRKPDVPQFDLTNAFVRDFIVRFAVLVFDGAVDSTALLCALERHMDEAIHAGSGAVKHDFMNTLPWPELIAAIDASSHADTTTTPQDVRRTYDKDCANILPPCTPALSFEQNPIVSRCLPSTLSSVSLVVSCQPDHDDSCGVELGRPTSRASQSCDKEKRRRCCRNRPGCINEHFGFECVCGQHRTRILRDGACPTSSAMRTDPSHLGPRGQRYTSLAAKATLQDLLTQCRVQFQFILQSLIDERTSQIVYAHLGEEQSDETPDHDGTPSAAAAFMLLPRLWKIGGTQALPSSNAVRTFRLRGLALLSHNNSTAGPATAAIEEAPLCAIPPISVAFQR